MSDSQRIDPVLVEKARKAYELAKNEGFQHRECLEAVIRVVRADHFDELGLKELQDALRLLAAAHYDEALISDTQEIEYDDLFDRKLLAQSRDITDEYTTYLTREGYEFVIAQLKWHWRLVEQGDVDSSIPDDLMCPCGHTAYWHADGGRGQCEYGAPGDCDCKSLGEGAEGELGDDDGD